MAGQLAMRASASCFEAGHCGASYFRASHLGVNYFGLRQLSASHFGAYVLVQQGWKQWRRVCRQAATTAAQEPEHEKVVEATVYESSSRYSSSFNSGDAQFTVRRGRDLQTVWVRTEEQRWTALSSISVTCGQESDELTAFCDNCHRRAYSLTSCGRKCRCLHMLCLECFHRHRCLWVATRVSRREIFSGFR